METLTAKNITKYYDTQCVLDKLNFTLKKGEITGLLGPNGAGKTTTMNILTGYLQDWSGSVTVLGKDMRKNTIFIRKNIGYLPEHNPLDEQLYVNEYLSGMAALYLGRKEIAKKVKQVIEKVALGTEQHKKIGQLSKGYKQRVGLAQALVHNPKILILDEPMSGLDPNQLETIRQLIRQESQEKIVLLSTHIMQEVEALCDRSLIINKGKLLSDVPVKAALQTVKLVFAKPILNLRLPFEATIQRLAADSFLIHANGKADIRPLLFNFAKDSDLTLLTLAEVKQDLTAIFTEMTQKSL